MDWDRRLFDALIPLPEGTSYNSYLVRADEKTALIDAVDPPFAELLFSRLDDLKLQRLDYLIANHAEQDHSGAIPQVLERFPEARVVTTPKGKGLLLDHLHLREERIQTVADGETLSLGNRTLEFIHAPWVHWPETMLTYLREEKVLFPCDLFGSHLATNDLLVINESQVAAAAKRYYAEIMMPFRTHIQRHLDKLKGYEISLIAPSHGPLYPRPALILDLYRDWAAGEPLNLVVLPYVSMHGSTLRMVDHLVEALQVRGAGVIQFNLAEADLGKLAMALVDAATIVLAAPQVLSGAHPKAIYAAALVNVLRPKARHAAIIGSYGWGGKMVEQLTGLLSNLKVELLPPVLARGLPGTETFQALDRLAEAIVERHASLRPART
jgi:flavorubredoxin